MIHATFKILISSILLFGVIIHFRHTTEDLNKKENEYSLD